MLFDKGSQFYLLGFVNERMVRLFDVHSFAATSEDWSHKHCSLLIHILKGHGCLSSSTSCTSVTHGLSVYAFYEDFIDSIQSHLASESFKKASLCCFCEFIGFTCVGYEDINTLVNWSHQWYRHLQNLVATCACWSIYFHILVCPLMKVLS